MRCLIGIILSISLIGLCTGSANAYYLSVNGETNWNTSEVSNITQYDNDTGYWIFRNTTNYYNDVAIMGLRNDTGGVVPVLTYGFISFAGLKTFPNKGTTGFNITTNYGVKSCVADNLTNRDVTTYNDKSNGESRYYVYANLLDGEFFSVTYNRIFQID